MNGFDIKKTATNKAKQVANNASSNGSAPKKRRAKQDLQPIITTEQQSGQGSDLMTSYVATIDCALKCILLLRACYTGTFAA